MKNQSFEIEGWGHLKVDAEGEHRCAGAVGVSVNIEHQAGGVMDYQVVERLRNFLNQVLKEKTHAVKS